jgi:hypothetical protein
MVEAHVPPVKMKPPLIALCLVSILAGCAAPQPPPITRIPAAIVVGKVRTIDFSGLTGSKPFIAVGTAYVTISEPESLKGKELLVGSSDDYPFHVGDEVEFDFTGIGIDKAADGTLHTEMLYRLPIRIRPIQPPQTTTGSSAPDRV